MKDKDYEQNIWNELNAIHGERLRILEHLQMIEKRVDNLKNMI